MPEQGKLPVGAEVTLRLLLDRVIERARETQRMAQFGHVPVRVRRQQTEAVQKVMACVQESFASLQRDLGSVRRERTELQQRLGQLEEDLRASHDEREQLFTADEVMVVYSVGCWDPRDGTNRPKPGEEARSAHVIGRAMRIRAAGQAARTVSNVG